MPFAGKLGTERQSVTNLLTPAIFSLPGNTLTPEMGNAAVGMQTTPVGMISPGLSASTKAFPQRSRSFFLNLPDSVAVGVYDRKIDDHINSAGLPGTVPIRLRQTATKSGALNPRPKEFTVYRW